MVLGRTVQPLVQPIHVSGSLPMLRILHSQQYSRVYTVHLTAL